MLIIRKEHMFALSQSMLVRFEGEMFEHLRSVFRSTVARLSDLELHQFIQNSIRLAESQAIIYKTDIRRFLEFLATNGLDIHRNQKLAWAREILADSTLTGTEKIDRIDACELFAFRDIP